MQPVAGTLRQGLTGTAVAARDLLAAQRERLRRRDPTVRPDAIEAGVAWLVRTHDVTGRQGSSKGYSLLRGWTPAYPETTGYVLEVLLWQADRTGDPGLARRAGEMADWEASVQEPDGGIMEGDVTTTPRRSIVFNTGMVLHGWMTQLERGDERHREAADRAATFLADRMGPDGTWDPAVEYAGIPHTYNSRVAWAMLRYARHTGDERVREAATRQLGWVLDQQRPNGWFEHCVFKTGMVPSTHGLAYTLRGLLESHALFPDERLLEGATRASEVLIRKAEVLGRMPGAFDDQWRPTVEYVCLTGLAQLGGVWLRLHALTDDARYLNAGLLAVERAAGHQERLPIADVDGALAGSFPVWGRYAPLQYPNWATRFLVESLMLREEALRG